MNVPRSLGVRDVVSLYCTVYCAKFFMSSKLCIVNCAMLKNNHLSGDKTLRELRESMGYSQEAFAAKLKLTRNAVMRYELGLAEPKAGNFLQMARVLGVSLKTLAKSMGMDISDIPDDCDCN